MKVSISKAALELGVHQGTLRRWEAIGKISVERTPQGHRRYNLEELRQVVPKKQGPLRRTFCYARVSSHDQKEDLCRQMAVSEKQKTS